MWTRAERDVQFWQSFVCSTHPVDGLILVHIYILFHASVMRSMSTCKQENHGRKGSRQSMLACEARGCAHISGYDQQGQAF
jgi:hypothetical protein